MNDLLKTELARNITGYFLVLVGMAGLAYGAHFHIDKIVDTAAVLVSAALLAFQQKRSPDGNTTTTSVTVPAPAIPPTPPIPVVEGVVANPKP